MLVLGRKEQESVQIGDEVRITVVRISATRVRLGIQAPSNIVIVRGELADQPLTKLALNRGRVGPGRRTTKR